MSEQTERETLKAALVFSFARVCADVCAAVLAELTVLHNQKKIQLFPLIQACLASGVGEYTMKKATEALMHEGLVGLDVVDGSLRLTPKGEQIAQYVVAKISQEGEKNAIGQLLDEIFSGPSQGGKGGV